MGAADTLGGRIRLARKKRGWTQDHLAHASGVGVATIRRAEGGKFEPRMDTTRRLAEVLAIRPAWLMVGEEPMVEEGGDSAHEQT